jgi:hypothetical protein
MEERKTGVIRWGVLESFNDHHAGNHLSTPATRHVTRLGKSRKGFQNIRRIWWHNGGISAIPSEEGGGMIAGGPPAHGEKRVTECNVGSQLRFFDKTYLKMGRERSAPLRGGPSECWQNHQAEGGRNKRYQGPGSQPSSAE